MCGGERSGAVIEAERRWRWRWSDRVGVKQRSVTTETVQAEVAPTTEARGHTNRVHSFRGGANVRGRHDYDDHMTVQCKVCHGFEGRG